MAKAKLFTDIHEIMTMKGAHKKEGRKVTEKDLSIIRNGAMVTEGDKIIWVGKASSLPAKYSDAKKISCEGQNVFPGFIDCHTHSVFAGNRRDEFEMRNKGMSYQDIALLGGGIHSTVKATRRASRQKLTDLGQQRIDRFISQGVTTVEVKSGYGLSLGSEYKILNAVGDLKKARIIPTFLGAHAIPEDSRSATSYLHQLRYAFLKIRKLCSRVDMFVEKGYFTHKDAQQYLSEAKVYGFDITVHADQLSRTKATDLAVKLEAMSADHVIHLTNKDKDTVAESNTTAVLLPSADFYLQCEYPDARGLIDRGAKFALATDFNPGSSPTQNIALVGLLSRLAMKMTLPEVFSAFTVGGANALGLQNTTGALIPQHDADFFISPWSYKEFFYDAGTAPVSKVFGRGKMIHH